MRQRMRFLGFIVIEQLQKPRVGNVARIGRVHARHISPDFAALSTEFRGEERSGCQNRRDQGGPYPISISSNESWVTITSCPAQASANSGSASSLQARTTTQHPLDRKGLHVALHPSRLLSSHAGPNKRRPVA